MSDYAQYAAYGAAMDRWIARKSDAAQEPIRIPGLEALGRSSHGGAPVRGSVVHSTLHTPTPSLDIDDVAA